ncbi:multidrug efflux pump subunit AcrA (membrane-fusion protein) [Elusimicrobium posterum]|uniref:efflux RND transporter periplasmic adaptor subunit n=1 Tax=Elusimicrobium posterum TaxID=3116653 RepID=UPI003C70D4E8
MKKVKPFFKFLYGHKFKIIFVLVLCAAGAFGYYKYSKTAKKPKDEVLTETIKKGTIAISISKDGSFQAKDSLEVTSRADGKIKEIYVKEGDIVKEGQKLLVVQPGQSVHDKYLPIEITAPMSGTVLRCLNERGTSQSSTSYDLPRPGESVSGFSNYNPTCIMKVIKTGTYVVPIKIGEYDIEKIKVGMPVKITILSKPEQEPYEGFISLISPQPEVKEENRWDPDSNKVEFITVVQTKKHIKEILIGLSANVTIDLESKDDILTIPNSVIYEERNSATGKIDYFVYKKLTDKKALKTEVKLGIKNDNDAELLNAQAAGLAEGDVLFVDYEGAGVEVENAKK